MVIQQTFLKRGIVEGSSYILSSKNLALLRKKKWLYFLKVRREVNQLFRNDIFLVHKKIIDLRKDYSRKVLCKRRFFAYFSTLKNRQLSKMFLSNKVFSFRGTINYMELRLDVMLFRLNLVKSLFHAKCLIRSRLVYVNHKSITSPSFLLVVGDLVELRVISDNFSLLSINFPVSFIEVNYETFSAVLIELPGDKSLANFTFFYSFFIGLFDVQFFQDFK